MSSKPTHISHYTLNAILKYTKTSDMRPYQILKTIEFMVDLTF